MRFERGASNTFTIPARPTTSPSNWLLRFVKVDGGLEVLCIADAYAVTGMPVQLTFTEVDSAPSATDGEVTLSLGQWQLYVYEQASAVNLNYTLATRQPFDTLVEVVGAAVPDPPPTDPCAGEGDPVTIRTTDGLTVIDTALPGTNYDLPQSHIKYYETNGIAVNALEEVNTQMEEVENHLYPDIIIPSRQIVNSLGDPASSSKVTLRDLVDGFGPFQMALNGTVRLNNVIIGSVPSNATGNFDVLNSAEAPVGSLDVDKWRIADGAVQLKDSAANDIGSPTAVPAEGSVNVSAPDGVVQLTDDEANVFQTANVRSGQTLQIEVVDSQVEVRNSVPTQLAIVQVGPEGYTTYDVADSTITLPDGTTVGLPATVPLDVRSYRSGIVYNFGYILASGQTVSYRTGDEGSYRTAGFFNYTRPVYPTAYAELSAGTWDTLAANNIHGNTLRFTNRSGGAAATSGNRVIQDHLTGLEWYIPSSLPADTTWNAAIDAAEASTVESRTDWMLPTDRMLDSISKDDISVPFNYAPFNLGTVNLWTSTTNPQTTTQARRTNSAAGAIIGTVDKSGNNGSYIFCRKFI